MIYRGECRKTPHATASPSLMDIGWVAGFLEGEASFSRTTVIPKGGGGSARVMVRQKDPEPLGMAQRFCGGTIRRIIYRTPSNIITMKGACDLPIWDWSVHGARARGLMMTVFNLMSTRRKKQILVALEKGV